MDIKKSAPATMAVITTAAGGVCATFAHYWTGDSWAAAYLVAIAFGIVAMFVTVLAQE